LPFSVEFEQELWNKRSDLTAQAEWLKEVGATSSLPKIIKTGFKELALKYYFTAGNLALNLTAR
jgi:obg-like ATPase 1